MILPIACISFAGGCMVGPNYRTPQEKLPNSFDSISSSQPADSTTSLALDLTHWWKSLNDPALDGLIDQAVSSNLDLAIAAVRIEEARAESGVVAAGLWPMVGLGARFPDYRRVSEEVDRAHWESRPRGGLQLRQNVDKNGLSGLPSLYLTTPGHHPWNYLFTPSDGTDPNLTTNVRAPIVSSDPKQRFVGRDEIVYQGGFEVVWELDAFGGVRRAIEAAQADVEAQTEAWNDVMVMLLADVARTYVEFRGFQKRLDIAARNIVAQQTTVELVRTRFRNGLTSDLDVALAERQLQTTQSRVPALRQAQEEARHRLSFLLDSPLDQLSAQLTVTATHSSLPPTVPAGLPSDLLRSRPDIRRAERDLAAATARIGVAMADLYPRFSLTGSFGLQSSDLGRILESDALAWNAGPSLRWPVFDAGRIRENIVLREAHEKAVLLDYRRVILTAVKEVQDALVGYASQLERLQKLLQAVDSSNRAVQIAKKRYEKGLTDFLNVLDSERALYELEDQAAGSEQDAISQLILLYKALGRGWESPTKRSQAY